MVGERFGRLTVIEPAGKEWLCRCECGNLKTTDGWRLKSGNIRSCGCLQKQTRFVYYGVRNKCLNVHPNSMASKKWGLTSR